MSLLKHSLPVLLTIFSIRSGITFVLWCCRILSITFAIFAIEDNYHHSGDRWLRRRLTWPELLQLLLIQRETALLLRTRRKSRMNKKE